MGESTPSGARPRLVDWLVTPLFLLGFAGALFLFDPLIRVASLFGLRPQEYAAGLLQVVMLRVFRLAGTRILVERDPAVRDGVPYLVIANHQSLFDIKTKENAFYDADHKYNLSKLAFGFIAGQIKHIDAMCAVLCPTVNSYKRLVAGFEAPVYVTWAAMNRSALLRVPKWFKAKKDGARIELRCPDPSCNPYLAFAVMLKAGLDGIKNNLKPPEPVEENIYQLDEESLATKKIAILPTSLRQALDALHGDKLLQDVLGRHLFERYVDVKSREWDQFRTQVTPWEIETYLDIF